jgi:hypothetical protein
MVDIGEDYHAKSFFIQNDEVFGVLNKETHASTFPKLETIVLDDSIEIFFFFG